ncbi:MAG: hypothetical protein K2Y35_19285 [Burkholderiales bacterium]|nr:hypothetical protein [Burkholderiales bacterium]
MNTHIGASIGLLLLSGAGLGISTDEAAAQQKYSVTRPPTTTSQYLQEHAIDVDDIPGHQVRVYEIRYSFPARDLAFGGVFVKQSLTRGSSDYIGGNGPFTTYTVYTLEDGNRVFSRSTGTTQADPDGTRHFTFVENYLGGTGKFKGIRGQMRGSGSRAPGAKSLEQQSAGEYWLDE